MELEDLTVEISQKVDKERLKLVLKTLDKIEGVVITKAEAARLLRVSRTRINNLLKHQYHAKQFRLYGSGRKEKLYLLDILKYKDRQEFSGRPKNGI